MKRTFFPQDEFDMPGVVRDEPLPRDANGQTIVPDPQEILRLCRLIQSTPHAPVRMTLAEATDAGEREAWRMDYETRQQVRRTR